MRFSVVFVLLALLGVGCGSHDKAGQLIVGTWQRDGSSDLSITILGDSSFISSFESTNHTVVLTYQGTWQVKDREMMITVTNVVGSIRHESVGSIERFRIIELDSHHMTFAYQAASNYVATNTYVRRP